ncbi:hypothetical protein DM860_002207 [Cuscuta australis]|uniref:Uncharacterized protein n=1 Tax=Cuscuta australis TaxID=267555 RepID=A0A328DXA6_9ASTE|nr:hypothetical protein DM860_002207 [Cuscuta australis]
MISILLVLVQLLFRFTEVVVYDSDMATMVKVSNEKASQGKPHQGYITWFDARVFKRSSQDSPLYGGATKSIASRSELDVDNVFIDKLPIVQMNLIVKLTSG